jgi:hypothetical protein
MYNLSVLNDKEFELLGKDILENELGVTFQVFKSGRDKGIDLRHACDVENKIIVQAKHYLNSTFANLKHVLASQELSKISKLSPAPERYILFTSLSLSVSQVDELVELLKPFTTNSNDIYGRDRIFEALKNVPQIEKKYFKLWLSSSNILINILNNGAVGRSEFYREKILSKLKIYVPTRNFDEAISKLKEHKFIVITGDPGVGKTTISYLIICGLLAEGFELLHISDRISEAESLLSQDEERKQVVYFDDFLGSHLAEILSPRNSQSSIVGLIERISHQKNKLLILTTRTTILNQSLGAYEKLSNSGLTSLSKYRVELKQYSRLDRALILYNHLYHSKLFESRPEYFQAFFEKKNYVQIIDHKNYSPRLIEFITNDKNLAIANGQEPMDFIISQFNNPDQVWRGAYENQLADEDRFLLTSLVSLGGYNIPRNILENAFGARIKYEISENGFRLKNDVFNSSVKKLLDGFISASKDLQSSIDAFSLLNPSIADFILSYLQSRPQELFRIFQSAFYVEQFTKILYPDFKRNQLSLGPNELNKFALIFNDVAPKLGIATQKRNKYVELLRLYFSLPSDAMNEELAIEWLNQIGSDRIYSSQSSTMIGILPKVKSMGQLHLVDKNWDKIANDLFDSCGAYWDFEEVKDLFEELGYDLNSYLETTSNLDHLHSAMTSSFASDFRDAPGLSESDVARLARSGHEGNRRSAIVEIEEMAEQQFFDYVVESGFSEYTAALCVDLDVDADSILDKLIENASDEEPVYYAPLESYRHNPIGINKSVSQGSGSISEETEIDRLFEK